MKKSNEKLNETVEIEEAPFEVSLEAASLMSDLINNRVKEKEIELLRSLATLTNKYEALNKWVINVLTHEQLIEFSAKRKEIFG